MKIDVELPDDLGKRARGANLPFSDLLERAVRSALDRRRIESETRTDQEEHLIDVKHPDGYDFKGRIIGKIVRRSPAGELYLTSDERLLLHDSEGHVNAVKLDDLAKTDIPAYIDAAVALGEKPIIDL